MATGQILRRSLAGLCAVLGIVFGIVIVTSYLHDRGRTISNRTLKALPVYRLQPPGFIVTGEWIGKNDDKPLFGGDDNIRLSRQSLTPTRDIAYSVRSWYQRNPAFREYHWQPGPQGDSWMIYAVGVIPNHPDYRVVISVRRELPSGPEESKFRPKLNVVQSVIRAGNPDLFGSRGNG